MAGCDFGWVSPSVGGYCVGDGTGAAPEDLGDSAFDDIAESAAEAASTTVEALGSAWMNMGSPDLSDDSGPVAFLQGSTLWLTTFTAVLCLLVAAGHVAWQRRSEPARQALQGLLNLVAASSAGVATVGLLTSAGDKFSVWIIDRSTGCRQISGTGEPVAQCVAEFDKRTSAMLSLGGTDSSFLVLMMAMLVVVGTIAQIALMIVRMAMLVILTGSLPLTAAASSTPTGRVWFRRSVGWLLAFVLYKPAAAVVYAAAFSMTGQAQENEVVSMVSGVVLTVLACFTLPALMRFAAPLVQAVASGAGRSAGASSTGSGRPNAAATGALPVPHLRSLAAGRSVAGAVVNPERTGTTGARTAPGAAAGGPAPEGTPDGGRTAHGRRTAQGGRTAGAARSAHQAHQAGPADAGQTAPGTGEHDARLNDGRENEDRENEDRGRATAPAPVPVRAGQHTDDQQEEPRGSR